MSSKCLSQPPLLVLTVAQTEVLAGASLPPLPRKLFKASEVAEYSKTARVVAEPPWQLLKASQYLRELVSNNVNQSWRAPPDLQWVFNGQAPSSLPLPVDPDWVNFAPMPPRTV
eukprot:4366437-Pyramimonas_sp.AAC.1